MTRSLLIMSLSIILLAIGGSLQAEMMAPSGCRNVPCSNAQPVKEVRDFCGLPDSEYLPPGRQIPVEVLGRGHSSAADAPMRGPDGAVTSALMRGDRQSMQDSLSLFLSVFGSWSTWRLTRSGPTLECYIVSQISLSDATTIEDLYPHDVAHCLRSPKAIRCECLVRAKVAKPADCAMLLLHKKSPRSPPLSRLSGGIIQVL